MGYTHYWEVKEQANTKLDSLYKDALKDIAKVVESNKEILAGSNGEPKTKPKTVGGISFNGIEEDSHETFSLPANANSLSNFSFCKTAHKPYDVVVTACLTRLAEVPGISVSSDGSAGEWNEGVALASTVLGRKLKNPLARKGLSLVKSFTRKVVDFYKIEASQKEFNTFESFQKEVGLLDDPAVLKKVKAPLGYESNGLYGISELKILQDFCKSKPEYHIATLTSDSDDLENELDAERSEEADRSVIVTTIDNAVRTVNRQGFYLCNKSKDETIHLVEVTYFR